ncbi:hypothetical protein GA0070606_0500 [Micromonospora citrea]|uniref:Fibronectin type-III domain-containing protein n=1 Tax=Micromonospora citrea TaxID=47855 RepID=A0A1C6TSU8_9ACTN|nr:fibronectin type III domain-containing protein [Micromonospora citrea]SCL44886.1 hypothetical protein GA0070606_0500 [Micromonospora citrea]
MPDPLIPGLPLVQSLRRTRGTLTVLLEFPPGNEVTAGLFKGVGETPLVTATNTDLGIDLTYDGYEPHVEYYVALSFGGDRWGLPVTVLWQQPALGAISIDDRYVDVAWTLPEGPVIDDVTVALRQDDGPLVTSVTCSGGTARLPLAAALATGGVYRIHLTARRGVATSEPVSSEPLILQALGISEVRYEPGPHGPYRIDVTATCAPSGRLVAELLAGTTVAAAEGQDATATVSLTPPVPLDPATRWQLALRHRKGSITGPPSVPVEIPLRAPELTGASYDGTHFFASWQGTPGARVVVTRRDTGDIVAETSFRVASCGQLAPKPAIQVDKTYDLTLAPIVGQAYGPPGPPTPLIVAAPALKAVVAGQGQVVVRLTADPAATGTELSITTADGPTHTATAGVTGGYLALPTGLSTELSVAARAVAGDVVGPLSKAVPVLSVPPSITEVTTGDTAVTGKVASAPDSRLPTPQRAVTLRVAGVPTGVPVNAQADGSFSVTLPDTGTAALTLTAVVSGTSSSGATVTGPSSPPAPVTRVTPARVDVQYDGRSAWVQWPPVDTPGLTGYQVTLLNGTTPAGNPVTVTTTGVRLTAAHDPTRNYQVTVRAVTDSGLGPATAAVPLFQAGWYPSDDRTKAPHLRPFTVAAMTPSKIKVFLPNLFAGSPSGGLPDVSPFVLQAEAAPFGYTLTMPAESIVWQFDGQQIRSGVRDAWNTFQSALSTARLTPLGWHILRDAVSRSMPQTFDETLSYAYGFEPGTGVIDLVPGMILRADFGQYQWIGADAIASKYLDGYVGSQRVEYEIGSYVSGGEWLPGFDAFLSAIVGANGTEVPSPNNDGTRYSGGEGLPDLYYPQFRQPYLRLVYPPKMLASGSYDARPACNIALLAAGDRVSLSAATTNLRQGQPTGAGVAVAYLRGRVTLTACVRVWLDGTPTVVPVGTRVGNLLETAATRPPVLPTQTVTPGVPISGLTLTRATGYAITDPSTGSDGYAVGAGMPVRLDWGRGMAYDEYRDWLSLPLLAGDRISTGGRGAAGRSQ